MIKCGSDIKKDIEATIVKMLPDFSYDEKYGEFIAPGYYWNKNPSEFIQKIKSVNTLFKTIVLKPSDVNHRPGVYQMTVPETLVQQYFDSYQNLKERGINAIEVDKGVRESNAPAYFTPNTKTEKNIADLEKKLVDGFLKDFGITLTEYKSMQDDLGINSYTASDFIAKAIAYQEGESIIPEVMYFAFTMLGKSNNKLRSELRYLIRGWDKWDERFTYHAKMMSIKEKTRRGGKEWYSKIKDLIVLDYLRETLIEYYRNPVEFEKEMDSRWSREDFVFKHRIPNQIWKWIMAEIRSLLRIFSQKYNAKEKSRLKQLSLSIASEILDSNYDYFNYNLKEGQIQRYYQESIDSDPKAKSIIEYIKDEVKLILTGSLVMRRAGKIFRPEDEGIHDIDWIVPYILNSRGDNKKVLDKIKNLTISPRILTPDSVITNAINKEVENFDWYKQLKEKYPTLKIITGFYGKDHLSFQTYTVLSVIDGEFYDSDGEHEEEFSYNAKDPLTKKPITKTELIFKKHKKGDYIKGTGYAIDYFIRLQPFQEEHENYFAMWKQITQAKLEMDRAKDFTDWKYFTPYLPSDNRYNFEYDNFRHFSYEATAGAGTTFEQLATPEDPLEISAETINQRNSDEFLTNFINAISLQIPGVKVDFITPEEAKALTENTNNPWKGQPGFFHGGKIYFIKGKLTHEVAFHEFSHPLIRSIAKLNPTLFNNLYQKSQSTERGRAIKDKVASENPGLTEADELFKEEVLVMSLTKAYIEDVQELPQDTGFTKFIKDLMYAIKQAIRQVFGDKKIKISTLGPETSLISIMKMLKEGKVFDINTDLISQEDVAAYFTDGKVDHNKALEDITKLATDANYPELLEKSTEIYNIITKAIQTISHNPKFKDVKNLLIDEFDRADLQEMATNMRKYTEHIKNKLNKVHDKAAFQKAHAEAMLNTLIRLQSVVNKINDELVKMQSSTDDERTKLFAASNFDYLLKFWSDFVDDFATVLADKNITNGELRLLVTDIKDKIELSRNKTVHFYGKGAKEILFDELKPIAARIDDQYKTLIENLEKKGANPKVIDSWYKEYHGLSKKEQAQLDALSAKAEWELSLPELAQKESLIKRSFKGAKITKEKFDRMFDGNLGDTNMFSHYLEGYMFNPDLVVGSFALYLKNNISNVLTNFQRDANTMVHELKPLLDRAGYTPRNSFDMINRLGYKETVLVMDKDTLEVKPKEVWRFISRFWKYDFDLTELQGAIQAAELAYNRTGSEDAWEKMKKASMAFRKHLREYMVQENVPDFYLKDSILEGDPIGEEAALLQDEILTEIRRIKEPLATEEQLINSSAQIRKLWRKYRLLADVFDINGIKKKNSYKDAAGVTHYTSDPVYPEPGRTAINNQLTIAEKLTEYRSFKMLTYAANQEAEKYYNQHKSDPTFKSQYPTLKDWKDYYLMTNKDDKNIVQTPFTWVPRTGAFQNAYIKYRHELNTQNLIPAEYEEKLNKWVIENTRVAIEQGFYDERDRIIKRLGEISALIENNTGQKLLMDSLYKELGALARAFRDDDGQPMGSEMNEDRLAQIKRVEEQILEEQKKLTRLSGLSSEESDELDMLYSIPYHDLETAQEIRKQELLDKKDNMGLSDTLKEEFQSLISELQQLRYKEATIYYADIVNTFIEDEFTDNSKALVRALFGDSGELTTSDMDRFIEDGIIDKFLKENPKFKVWFHKNHIRKKRYSQQAGEIVNYWERIYAWNVTKPVDPDYYQQTIVKDENGVVQPPINRVPGFNFMSKQVKPEYRTGYDPITGKVKRIVGVHITNKGIDDFLPRTDVEDKRYLNPAYDNMTAPDKELLNKVVEWHLKSQEGLGRKAKLWLDIPRYRMNAYEMLQMKNAKKLMQHVYGDDNSLRATFWKSFRGLWSRLKDSADTVFNWQDDIMLASSDIFDQETTEIPITGMYDIDIDEVSPDVMQGVLRYMLSAETHKRLVAINPLAKALKQSLPDTIADKKISRWNFLKRARIKYLKGDEKSIRWKTINNMIDREIHGQKNTGPLGDDTIANRLAQGVLGSASFSFFALNIPSALKNMFGAQFQGMIEAVGGQHMTMANYAKAEFWSMGAMSQMSATLYTGDIKPLDVQIMEAFDPVQDRMKMKLPQILSRTLPEDVAGLSWLYNFRKWTETQASIQVFGGIMYTEQVDMNGKKIDYLKAWELDSNGVIKLKAGIDPEYDMRHFKYIVKPGDTIASISSFHNITPEQFKERTKVQDDASLVEGNVLTLGTSEKFHIIQNTIHTVLNNLNGAYAAFDQPEAQRYLAFRMISFLRRFFTTMALNRWGVNRFTPGVGQMTEGYYITTLKMGLKLVSMHPSWMAHLAPKEKIAIMKFTAEVVGLLLFIFVILPALGWDDDDPERYEKMRERSGALQLPGLTEEDPDHPFEIGGFMHNHAIALALQIQAENGTFFPYPEEEFGLDDYMAIASPKIIAFGPTLNMYYRTLMLGIDQASGDPSAYYKRDMGPYKWQHRGGSKAWTSVMKSIGLSGSTLDPVTATKNFSSIQATGKNR